MRAYLGRWMLRPPGAMRILEVRDSDTDRWICDVGELADAEMIVRAINEAHEERGDDDES